MKKEYQNPSVEMEVTFAVADIITFSQTHDYGTLEEKGWNEL